MTSNVLWLVKCVYFTQRTDTQTIHKHTHKPHKPQVRRSRVSTFCSFGCCEAQLKRNSEEITQAALLERLLYSKGVSHIMLQ